MYGSTFYIKIACLDRMMTCGIRVMCGLVIAVCVPIRYGEYLLIIEVNIISMNCILVMTVLTYAYLTLFLQDRSL